MQLLSMRGAGRGQDSLQVEAQGARGAAAPRAAWRCHLGVVPTLAGEEGPEEEPR